MHPSRQEDQEQLLTPEPQFYVKYIFVLNLSTGKEFDKYDEGKIKLSELRNVEIAFVPWKRNFHQRMQCGRRGEGGGHKPQKIFEMQFNMKGLESMKKTMHGIKNAENMMPRRKASGEKSKD